MAASARTSSDPAESTTAPSLENQELDVAAAMPALGAVPAWGAHKPTEPTPVTGCE
jgi:hypothetical protein